MPFLATGEILAVWFACTAALIGIGFLLIRLFEIPSRLGDAFWMGFAAWVAYLEAWHLVRPINGITAIVPAIVGTVGLLICRKPLSRRVLVSLRIGRGPLIAYLALVIVIALCSTGLSTHYDTGFYGAPAVRWNQQYAAVPGLANLHGRLGFDSAVMLCIAALGPAMYPQLGFHAFTGFVVLAMAAVVMPAWMKAWRHETLSPRDWFIVTLSVIVADWILRRKFVSAETDAVATTATLVGVAMMIEHLSHPNSSGSRLPAIAAVLALAVDFKTSVAIVAGGTWVVGAVWIFRHRRPWLKYFLIPTAIIAPCIACNVVTSGYLFYPLAFTPFHFDWTVPANAVHYDAMLIQSIARKPLVHIVDTRGWGWLGGWVVGNVLIGAQDAYGGVPLIVPICIGVLAGLSPWLFRNRRGDSAAAFRPWLWLFAPTICGIAFWFYVAPDPRFGESATWGTAALLVAWAASTAKIPSSRPIALVLLLLALIGPWPTLPDEIGNIMLARTGAADSVGVKPGMIGIDGMISLPYFPPALRYTRSGLCVWEPEPRSIGAWYAPLPNSPEINPDLVLRDPGDMGKGFKIFHVGPGLPAETPR